jgi:hypothetical protein
MCGKWLCCPWEWSSCEMFKVYLLLMDFFFEEVQLHFKIYSFHQQSNYVKTPKFFVSLQIGRKVET